MKGMNLIDLCIANDPRPGHRPTTQGVVPVGHGRPASNQKSLNNQIVIQVNIKKRFFLALSLVALCSGCLFTSKTRLNESQAQNRILSQQNAAQLTEIENLKTHSHDMENKLIRSEESTALLKEQIDLDRRQLANYEHEHAQWYEQFKALAPRSQQNHRPISIPGKMALLTSQIYADPTQAD